MNFIRIKSLQCHGIESRPVSIEVLGSRGLSQLSLTGLPDAWLRDSRDKIRSLVGRFTRWGPLDRVLIHLLPADQSKSGAHLELPILLGCLAVLQKAPLAAATRDLLERYNFVGALTLEGKLEATPLSEALQDQDPASVLGPRNFSCIEELWAFLERGKAILPATRLAPSGLGERPARVQVEGKIWERFWLLLAAIAEVPALMLGPPGSGKSHLARWAHGLIPEPDPELIHQIQQIARLAGFACAPRIPLQCPHPKSALSEFVGNIRQSVARPGFFSLAHGGLLILDEFTEMNRDSREILRTLLDQKMLCRNVSSGLLIWPANFWLIATANPCPCGFSRGEDFSRCHCTEGVRRAYRGRLSGPVLDRMGVKLFVTSDAPMGSPPDFLQNLPLDADPTPLSEFVRAARKVSQTHLDWAQANLAETPFFRRASFREQQNKVRLLAALRSVVSRSHAELVALIGMQSTLERALTVSEALRT